MSEDPDHEFTEKLTDGPVVTINDAGLKLKMICPSITVIQNWSLTLSALVSVDESSVLEGSYDAWQELFSHMLDETLLMHSMATMEFDLLAELLVLSRRYNIIALEDIYTAKVESLISEATITKVRPCFANACSLLISHRYSR